MGEKCIIYISSTNYKLVSAGTEKFMGGVIDSFKEKNVHALQFFPLVNINNRFERIGVERNYIGVNYDGVFVGTYLLEDMASATRYLAEKYNLVYDRVIINQLHSWNLIKLTEKFDDLGLPIILIVHDYMMVCPYMMSQDSDALKCGNFIDRPSASHCGECKYKKIGRKHFEEMNAFFINNNEKICRVIFPSCSAEKNWLNVFPSLAEKSIVRPHLKYDILNEEKKWNKTIRIGYLGFISDIKGYSEWLQLMRKLDKRKFDFYYFGGTVDQAEKDGANGVMVDFNSPEMPGMVEQLKKKKIDIAFLWSNCQETYSYTYYEAFEAGCWIATSLHSGNITDQVLKNKNGKAFKNLNDCIQFLSNLQEESHVTRIVNVKTNNSLTEFEPIEINISKIVCNKSKKPKYILSFLYSCLRRTK